jgi:hypothetical protein
MSRLSVLQLDRHHPRVLFLYIRIEIWTSSNGAFEILVRLARSQAQ